MSFNNSDDSRTSSERSLESDSSTGSSSRGFTTQSADPCFPEIEELKKFRLNDDSIEKRYEIIEKIGEGGFGAVYKGKHNFDRKIYAIKIIPLQSDDENEIMQLTREIEILSKLEHENIVRYHTSCKVNNDDEYFEKNYFCIQMEYCNKTLKTFIDNFISTQETENQRLKNLKQVLDALEYIHDKNVMHRDLNPKNIFLTHSGIIKIGDFGSSRQITVLCSDESNEVCRKSLTTYLGTKIYCAPELLEKGKYDKKIDWYSLGIIIFEMFHIFPPETADHEKKPIFSGIRSPEVIIPESLEPEIRDVVKGLLEHKPEYRMTLDIAADKVKQFSTKTPTVECGINWVQDSHSEKIRITKVAIEIFTGKPPKDEAHISNLMEVIETFPHPNVDSDEVNNHVMVPEPSIEDVDSNEVEKTLKVPELSIKDSRNRYVEYIRRTKPTDVVKNSTQEDEDSAKCKEEQQREVEDTHATGHLPYPEQMQTVTWQNVAELNSTSETEPQPSTVFSTVQKVPQSTLRDTETIEMDKEH